MSVDPGGGGGFGGGFGVDPVQLGGVAGQLGKACDDFNIAITDYVDTVCDTESDFGDFGVGPAWSTFDSAWAGEMDVISAALSELIQKVETTSSNYSTNEGNLTGMFQSIATP